MLAKKKLQDLLKALPGSRWRQPPTYKTNSVTLKPFVHLSLHFSSSQASEGVKHVYEFGMLLVSPNLLTGVATTCNSALLFCDLHDFMTTPGHYFGGFLLTWDFPSGARQT